MSQQGLKVTKATGPEWQQEGEVLAKTMRGQMVPTDIFDLAVKARDAFRQSKHQVTEVLAVLEDSVVSLALLAMAVLPILEIVLRRLFGIGVPGSGPIVQHLTLWVGFLGAAIAAREGKLLSLAQRHADSGRPRARARRNSSRRRLRPSSRHFSPGAASTWR